MNIFMLQCALVKQIFQNEGISLIINTGVMFGHAFDYWRDFDFSVDLNNFLTRAYSFAPT